MKLSRRSRRLLIGSFLLLTVSVAAVTTFPVKIKCPVCGVENEFFDYASWGSYVYQWPSKFQMVFWPQTYPTSLYICKKCHYTAWLWDFKNLDHDKIPAVQKTLSAISDIPAFEKYGQVPMSRRLMVAEHVYQTLGKDDVFWSEFYRVQGYHLAAEKKPDEAKQARSKARDLLSKLAADPKESSRKKEFLISLAAMEHFLGDDAIALKDLAAARATTFSEGKNAANYEQYLNQLADEYVEKIKAKSVPEDVNNQ